MEPDILLRSHLSQQENEQEVYPAIDFSEISKVTSSVTSNQQLFSDSQMVPQSDVNNFHSYAKMQGTVQVNELESVTPHQNQSVTASVQSDISLATATDLPTSVQETLCKNLIGKPIMHIPESVDMSSAFGASGLNNDSVEIQASNTAVHYAVLDNDAAAGQVQMVQSADIAMETRTNINKSDDLDKNSSISSDNIAALSAFSTANKSSDALCNVQLMTFSSHNHEPRIKLVHVTNAILLSVQFLCPTCGKAFLSAEALRVHTIAHTSEAPNQLGTSAISTIQEGKVLPGRILRKNLLNSGEAVSPGSDNSTNVQSSITDNQSDSVCQMDGQKGEDSQLYNRICSICKKVFDSSDLWQHYSSVHLQDDQSLQCFMCGKQMNSEKDLLKHIMSMHASFREPSPFCCAVCDRRFDSQTFLLNHMLHNHPITCNQDSENPPSLPAKRKIGLKSPGSSEKPLKLSCAHCKGTGIVPTKKHPCRICGKQFLDKRQLTRHISEHSEQTLCTVCHKLIFLKSLPKHMTLHTKPKSFECVDCNKTFREKCDLTKHMRTHTGEKPYTCEICQKSFTHSSQLPRHLRTHTGEKPFKCEMCDKVFSRRFGLQQHMSSHYTGKCLKCSHCGKEFRNRKGLQRHALTHSQKLHLV